MGRVRGLAAQAGWGLADQALSSLSNFVLGVFVARAVLPADFGAFGLGLATYWVGLNVSRAIATQPLVIRHSGDSRERWRVAASGAAGAAMVVGVVGGLACAVVGLLTRDALAEAFLAIGLSLPGLLIRDHWRFALFAEGRGGAALVNNFLMSLLLFAGLAAIAISGDSSVLRPMLAWGAAATVAAVIASVQGGAMPRPAHAARWWREHRDLGSRYVAEVTAGMGASQLALYGIGGIAGLAAVGALRAADIVLGPLNIVLQGIQLVAIPEGVRLLRTSAQRLRGACAALAAGLSALALVWGWLALAVPSEIGAVLLGSNWTPARSVLLPMTLALAGTGATTGALVGLRALAAANRSLRARLISSSVVLAGAITGAAAGGAMLAAWGLAMAMWVGAAGWWWQFLRALREDHGGMRKRVPASAMVTPQEGIGGTEA
jgi:hypothetical protein